MTSLLGMGRKKGRSDRFIAAMAIWIVAFSAIIPSLDRELLGRDVVIESGRHEACAHPHHDHTICIQFGKQDWATGSSLWLQVFPPTAGQAASGVPDVPPEFPHLIPTQSRAPPHTS